MISYRFNRFYDEKRFYAGHLQRFLAPFPVTWFDFEFSVQETQRFLGYMDSSVENVQIVFFKKTM